MYHINKKPKCTILVAIFLFAIILEVVKTEDINDNSTYTKLHQNHCECIHYNCGCCEYVEWDAVKLNGTLCTNATYLDKDYGFSITMTYNNVSIINETVSARNPPPICIGEDIESFPIEACLRLYDINYNETNFHCCFELEARFIKVNVLPLHLGCFDNNHTSSSKASLQITAYVFIFSIILPHIIIA